MNIVYGIGKTRIEVTQCESLEDAERRTQDGGNIWFSFDKGRSWDLYEMRVVKIRRLLRKAGAAEEILTELTSTIEDLISDEIYEDRYNARVSWD